MLVLFGCVFAVLYVDISGAQMSHRPHDLYIAHFTMDLIIDVPERNLLMQIMSILRMQDCHDSQSVFKLRKTFLMTVLHIHINE